MPGVVNRIYGWWSSKRTPYSDKFHTYTLEWDPKFIRVFVDRRTSAMLEVEIGRGRKRSFWDKAGFPLTAPNGSSQVVVTNPYSSASSDGNTEGGLGTDAAPYDQKFYLVMNLAVGGTSGWFPDGVGGKPWFDESLTAMRDFARAQDEWSKTWPTNVEDRAFRVDYVKMWERC
ncbi:hypothetical protein NLJ89_g6463 [Agrocybe chaxingu]|uniref:GH16 domain-containing protein n=1 Tax=Agrocybe chaxingu TaxID=84603 RepID=A0A9W8JY95_9AGAR|nr:hypothetical protein NLJ89_g6463 [Agrocybe chaxingu]